MFILTNDDGIDAPGIKALAGAIAPDSIIVAAPKDHLSGCGHQLTTHRPIQVERRNAKAYAIDGTPADCTRIALTHIQKEAKYVLSGINEGGNLGVDVYTSGTVAAVREASMHGVPGIAISQWIKKPLVIDWETATAWTVRVLSVLLERSLPPGSFWNVNLPHLEPGTPEPEIIFCQPSNHPLPVNYRVDGDLFYYYGEYAKRERAPGTDVDVCFSGNIAVTLLTV
ncbi:5'/3'-nucleotidase SurE [Gloeocapsa sp. PCC 73106]|uniref:5'/3'-nucleotidase SurE n=1 Tax=Gloeocapsa sp. PCC 73106 TaxID=102232 RepID=UPI0002AC3E12|nr:5'/3'-nucleotidase SurE [Gloeocapsa sp. PCC 73106]ELR98123.1 nucleotidase [Gloeocapsa sp. PCC 73106]